MSSYMYVMEKNNPLWNGAVLDSPLFGNSGFRASYIVNFTFKNCIEILKDKGLVLLEIPLNSFV